MGANIPYLVTVLKVIEGQVIVYGVTSDEVIEEARQISDVAEVLEAVPLDELVDAVYSVTRRK